MACQKLCKQGTDDIKVKVNIQAISLHYRRVKKMQGMELCISTFSLLYHSLTLFAYFWCAISTIIGANLSYS